MIAVLDFGSQYSHLIARRLRERGFLTFLLPAGSKPTKITELGVKALILSGGPDSVYGEDSPLPDWDILKLNLPILALCYSHQLLAKQLGGSCGKAKVAEFGRSKLKILKDSRLFAGLSDSLNVWMSHSDEVLSLPSKGVEVLASTKDCPFASLRFKDLNIYTLQFHPESSHTDFGSEILVNFATKIAGLEPTWGVGDRVKRAVKLIRDEVGLDAKVVNAVSGGVDSTVVSLLLELALGSSRVRHIFVDSGLLRDGESREVLKNLRSIGLKVRRFDASSIFIKRLKGIVDPERKRKIIGRTFIDALSKAASLSGFGKADFLAQGTLYSDLIESSLTDDSHLIKSHHNVGGLPSKLKYRLIEPLKEMFKDEVREVAGKLNLPDFILKRHPFPGPGLAVRIIGEVTRTRLKLLRQVDRIFIEELRGEKLYDHTWQAFAVLLGIRAVGVRGDRRSYAEVVALRAVDSKDGMSAAVSTLPLNFLTKVSDRITNTLSRVGRVVYDLSSKPPATIEWE